MKINEITKALEAIAPLAYQESFDNCGFIVGNPDAELKGILICLDSTEDVVDEAIKKGCNLIIAHHPIIFSGLKKLTGKNYIERTVIKAIKHDVAIYAIHTNLDNIQEGVNAKIAEKLGLINCRILSPKNELLRKLVTYAPNDNAGAVRDAMFAAGAGLIGKYSECSYNTEGYGTFKAGTGANPHVGEIGRQHHEPETRIEVVYTAVNERNIISALLAAHPYEEVAYDIYKLENEYKAVGSGMIGELPEPQDEMSFLKHAKSSFKSACVRHTNLLNKKVKTVAICGGSGSFVLPAAMAAKADVLVTGDFKYHQFFDADGKILIADIGHYESEQFTSELLATILMKKFPTFAVHLSEINTNPINYL